MGINVPPVSKRESRVPGNIKSKRQARLFFAVASGKVKMPVPGLSRAEAKESLQGIQPKKLPEFARSPFTQALLKSFRGMTPISLREDPSSGAPSDLPPHFPHVTLSDDRFPALQSSDIGDRFAVLVEGTVESKRREDESRDDPKVVVGLKLMRAALVPVLNSGPTPEGA